ncbi:hypothetical protein F8388_005805 [Cannabis sativa]|uniref:Legumain prodomain domain-containing protein n=1 Tax=Cannabis sativa TaxID=3483 RepID=A0A7J6HGW8_CANSA|nr:hypothetical protein F8388_005805 [Cannabis sativa]KAF4404583.1 hypothetical protein G4B88_005969 [Cannabis sativa]
MGGKYSVSVTIISFLIIVISVVDASSSKHTLFRNLINSGDHPPNSGSTRWAVLVAGSSGWQNYRHQANVCHAYQIVKKAGLKDENIIVFMYDDIAFNPNNPKPGVIINRPNGPDVYHGVPKDYTGDNATPENLYAVILGNRTALSGGSGKVVNSGPDDYIFIYYTDHGGPGVVEMAAGEPIYANDLVSVFYLEACDSGSMFEGLLAENISIYATTSTYPNELGWATYCPAQRNSTSTEDNSSRSGGGLAHTSHVMQFGDLSLSNQFVSTYMGDNPPTTSTIHNNHQLNHPSSLSSLRVSQRDADLFHFSYKFNKAPAGSKEKAKAGEDLQALITQRKQVDDNINRLGKLVLGNKNGKLLNNVRPLGQPLVDDWDCLKKLVKTYEIYCGALSSYGIKYTRHFANMCNVGVNHFQFSVAALHSCYS